jgi:hypothetical protein
LFLTRTEVLLASPFIKTGWPSSTWYFSMRSYRLVRGIECGVPSHRVLLGCSGARLWIGRLLQLLYRHR